MSTDLTLESLLPFGKFKGQQLEDLIEDEPEYMTWVAESEIVPLDEEVLELMTKRKLI